MSSGEEKQPTSSQDYDTLNARYRYAAQQWLLYKPRLQEAYEYSQPYRNKFYWEYGGERKGFEVFDTTAVAGTVSFTSKLMSALTPINQQFMKLAPGPSVPPKLMKKVEDMLARINDVIWRYIKKSDFSEAINESYFDLAIGTGCITTTFGDDDMPLVFDAHPLCDVFLERSTLGTIQNVWRRFLIPASDAPFIWPDAKIPDLIKSKMFTYVGNTDVEYSEGTLLFRKNDKNYYRTVVLCVSAGEIVLDKTSDSSPWTIFRWDVPPRETYGVGVTTLAMPTIKTANKVYEYFLRQGAFASSPPFEYNSNMPWNPYNTPLQPGMAFACTKIGNQTGESIRPIDFNANFEVTVDMITDLRNQINKIMFTDPLGSIQEPVRTATEMMMRQQAMLESMGPRFARLATEFLAPLLKRIIYILSKKGLLPAIQIDGKVIDIEFDMPIAKATGMGTLTSLVQIHSALGMIMSPELASFSMNIEELPAYFAAQAGVDSRLFKSPEQVSQVIQQFISKGMSSGSAKAQAA